MPSLYQRILRHRFNALPAVLRQFHDAPSGARALATFRIERAPGILCNIMATVMGFPRSGTDVPVRLQVVIDGERERWVRDFRGKRLRSVQWAKGDLLMERFGPVVFSSTMQVDGQFLHYEFQRSWFLGIPIPRALSPSVESYVEADDCRWWVMVRIFAPLVGDIIQYEGWVEPE